MVVADPHAGSSSRPTAPARPVPAQAPTSEPEQTSVVRRNGHVHPTVIVELPSPRRLRSSLGRPNTVIAVAPAPFAGPVTASSLVPALTPQVPLQHIPPKRGRGRPRKHSLPVMHVGQSQTPATTGALPIPAAPPHGHLGPSLRLRLRQRVPEASRDHPSSTSSSAKSRVRPARDGAAAARKAPRLSAPGRLTTTVPAVDAVGPSGFCGPTASPVTGPRPVPAAVAAQLPSPARSGVDIVRGFMDKNKRPRLSESDLLLFHQRHAGVDIAPDTTDKEKRPAGVYQTRSGVDIVRGIANKSKRPRLSESDLLRFHQTRPGADIAHDIMDKDKRPRLSESDLLRFHQTRSGVDIVRSIVNKNKRPRVSESDLLLFHQTHPLGPPPVPAQVSQQPLLPVTAQTIGQQQSTMSMSSPSSSALALVPSSPPSEFSFLVPSSPLSSNSPALREGFAILARRGIHPGAMAASALQPPTAPRWTVSTPAGGSGGRQV